MNRPWIHSPFFPSLLESCELDPETREQVRFFAENGYVVVDPGIPDATIEALNTSLRPYFRPNSDGYYSDETRVQDAWTFNPHVREVAIAPKVIDLLRVLYRREPIPFQTLNFRVGSQQRTHSDVIHFDSMPYGYMCGVWTALEDVDPGNGPLYYYHASHKLPRFDMSDLGVTAAETTGYEKYHLYEEFVDVLMKEQRAERTEVRLQRGQSLIWSANLFHGGSPIVDNGRTRLSQVTHFYFEGCLYYTPLFSDLALGRLVTRKVIDVRTFQEVKQFYNGAEVTNPGEWPPQAIPPWGAVPRPPKSRAMKIRDAVARLLRP